MADSNIVRTKGNNKNKDRSRSLVLDPSLLSTIELGPVDIHHIQITQENHESVVFIWFDPQEQSGLNLVGPLRAINDNVQAFTELSSCFAANHKERPGKGGSAKTDTFGQGVDTSGRPNAYYEFFVVFQTFSTKFPSFRAGNGRKRMIDAKCSRALGQFIRRNNEVTLQELAEKLQDQCKLTVSTSTISRHLNRLDYENCLPLNTPMLTEAQKEYRVEWAKEHLNDNWKSTIFTNESSFQLFRNTIRRWSKNPKEQKKRISKNRQKVHVWGSISYHGIVCFHSFQNIMDSDYYIDILENNLIQNVKQQFNNKWRFQQDNDHKHCSAKTKKWLGDNVPRVMDWPFNSPDLNPIENLWNIMKRRIEKRKPTNINELKTFAHEEWKKIEKDIIINLIKSMKIDVSRLLIQKENESVIELDILKL